MIVALSEEGYTQRVIAARVGCTQASVSGILKKMVFGNVKDVKIPARKRKTSQKEDRLVVIGKATAQGLWDTIRHAINHRYISLWQFVFFYLVIFTQNLITYIKLTMINIF